MSVILEAKHISKNFGLTQALKDVSVTIDEGEVIGLIGENGSGKSTLVRCINYLEVPTEGSVVIDGKELDSLSDLVSFGVAPGMLIYNTISAFSDCHWVAYIAILIPVMGELRLARFNIDDRPLFSECLFRPMPFSG